MQAILKQLLEFRAARDWHKFNTPQNIAKSIVLEASELLEVFQWKTDDSVSKEEQNAIADEMSDIYNWLILLAHDLKIDLKKTSLKKIQKNAKKYPIDKIKGIAPKYKQS